MRFLTAILVILFASSCADRPFYKRNPYVDECWVEKQFVFECERSGYMEFIEKHDENPPMKRMSFYYLMSNGDLIRQFGNYNMVYERVSDNEILTVDGHMMIRFNTREAEIGGALATITLGHDGISIIIYNEVDSDFNEFIISSNECADGS